MRGFIAPRSREEVRHSLISPIVDLQLFRRRTRKRWRMEVVRIAGAAKGGQAPKLAWGCVSTSDDDIGHQDSASTNTSSSIALPSSIRHPTHTDFVQELYLKELKAYKPTPVKDSDAQGQETDLAASLKEYESMAVEVEGQDASAVAANGEPVKHDWLMIEEDEEEPHH
ncbi:ATP synthase complex subunit H [Colletotrichum tofieldiae]|nr:ATP synthase complex subunit H [Colletotrichum tofieldiae]